MHEIVPEPVGVRMLGGQLGLDLLVVDDPPLGGVDQEDAPGMQPLLHEDLLGWNIQHADLGRHDDHVVGGDVVTRRTQSVPVEHGADDGAVGERDRRRAVPGLHQRRVVLVERPALRAHRLVVLPRLGDHHEDRVRQATARSSRGTRARCRTSRSPTGRRASPAGPSSGRRPAPSDRHSASRAFIQLMLPRSVLISPLWAM